MRSRHTKDGAGQLEAQFSAQKSENRWYLCRRALSNDKWQEWWVCFVSYSDLVPRSLGIGCLWSFWGFLITILGLTQCLINVTLQFWGSHAVNYATQDERSRKSSGSGTLDGWTKSIRCFHNWPSIRRRAPAPCAKKYWLSAARWPFLNRFKPRCNIRKRLANWLLVWSSRRVYWRPHSLVRQRYRLHLASLYLPG